MGEFSAVLACLVVALWLIALSAFDIRSRRLPNMLTLPGAAVILAVAVVTGYGEAAALGAAALFAVYATVHLTAPTAMGAGDVKLAVGIGALTGAFGVQAWLLCAFGASALTGVLGVATARRARSSLPHGPSMCVAAAAAVAAVRLPLG